MTVGVGSGVAVGSAGAGPQAVSAAASRADNAADTMRRFMGNLLGWDETAFFSLYCTISAGRRK
ncbi:hypothetical protein B5E80_08015 [Flavonifractor sp. An135]|nr:hypothetical protein B5E80_08015 [Flavonifractor sp. An135]